MKAVSFVGLLVTILQRFPRRTAGYELFMVQAGRDPSDFKPMPHVGPGVHEIRVRERAGTFRVIYVARFDEAVYVLHAFQ
jgi:phage-related protein